jgi:N-succinyldiaminopimelate aminotransferase
MLHFVSDSRFRIAAFLTLARASPRRAFFTHSTKATWRGASFIIAIPFPLHAPIVNPDLRRLQAYPFEKLRQLMDGARPNPELAAIRLHIGEPQHATPVFIKEALIDGLAGLASYPSTPGTPELRQAIAGWLEKRYALDADPDTEILPVNGSREALFSFAQAVIDKNRAAAPLVVCPNPFYQIYEGGAYLAGADARFLNTVRENDFAFDYESLPEEDWRRVQLLFVCSPANPTGKVLRLSDWQRLFALSDAYGFTIASDECYSEIHFDEAAPPLGGLQAAKQLGRSFERLVMFSSLSKRSNVPGMRSGFVAGDAAILKDFLRYRTYHGSAMGPAIQAASIAAWRDEAHVAANREQYRAKFAAVVPLLADALGVSLPDAGFYLWARTPVADTDFARRLAVEQQVHVLPGSFLARRAHGVNPGEGHVRIALVAPLAECVEAAGRIRRFLATL